MLNPYLFYQDTCEAAFSFYAKVLGGKIDAMMRVHRMRRRTCLAAPGRERRSCMRGCRCPTAAY